MSAQRSSAAARGRGSRNQYASSRGRARRGSTTGGMPRSAGTILALLALIALMVIIALRLQHATPEVSLPLADAAVIREQAADKHLDPALIAAVIYAETKFDPRTSSAGALGLMQILPATADFIARRSGGVRFTTSDLATPKINVAYGSWYLRYLLEHYEGDELLAVAAYNGGLANVDAWVASARAQGREFKLGDIPFPETKAYVRRVMVAQVEYRASYARELGLG